MNRLLRLMLVVVLLLVCYGCFIPGHGWIVPGGEFPGDQRRGDSDDHDRRDSDDHDRGGHGDRDGGKHDNRGKKH